MDGAKSRPMNIRTLDEASQRAAVVVEARSWRGTKYHHAADIKGAGVDCAMILVRVYVDLGLVAPFDPRPYTRDWMMHRSEERYLGFLLERARIVERAEAKPGDVVLFRVGRCFAHGGIISDINPMRLIHAYARVGCVIEDRIERCELAPHMGTAIFASYWGVTA